VIGDWSADPGTPALPMQYNNQGIPLRWDSLSLRLSTFFVVVSVIAAFAVGYLYDRGRAEAERERELAHLRLRAERRDR
jgi:hypothetical protein